MNPAVEESERLYLGLVANLQNEQSYLFGAYFPESPFDTQVSGQKCEARNECE